MPSVSPKGDGRWQIRAYLGRDEGGRQILKTRTVTAVSRRIALRVAHEWESELRRTGLVTGERATVTEAAQRWLVDRAALAVRTREEYERIVASYIEPTRLGSAQVGTVTALDVEAHSRYLRADKHVGEPQRLKVHVVLRQVFQWAVKHGLAHHNPVALADRPKQARSRINPPGVEDVLRLVKTANEINPTWGRLLLVAFGTGLRRGELAALRPSKIDGDELRIDESVAAPRGGTLLKDTKTHAARWVPLDDLIVGALSMQWESVRQRAAVARVELAADPFLFASVVDCSKPPHPDSLTDVMVRTRRAAGIEGTRLHDLRHAYAVFLEARGASQSTLQELLGHENKRTTGIYMHSDREQKRKAVRAFKELGA